MYIYIYIYIYTYIHTYIHTYTSAARVRHRSIAFLALCAQPPSHPTCPVSHDVTTCYLLPATYFLLPTTYYLLPTTNYQRPTTYYFLPTAGSTTCNLLPTTYYLLPTTCYLLLATYDLRPTSTSTSLSLYRSTSLSIYLSTSTVTSTIIMNLLILEPKGFLGTPFRAPLIISLCVIMKPCLYKHVAKSCKLIVRGALNRGHLKVPMI